MCRFQSNKNTHSLPLSYGPRSGCPYLSRDTTARMYPYPPRGHMFAISLDLALRIITSTKCKNHQMYKIVTEEKYTGVINTTINSNDDISVENSIQTPCGSFCAHAWHFPNTGGKGDYIWFNESGRFGALKSDSTLHFFRNACTKSGSLRFSQFSGC